MSLRFSWITADVWQIHNADLAPSCRCPGEIPVLSVTGPWAHSPIYSQIEGCFPGNPLVWRKAGRWWLRLRGPSPSLPPKHTDKFWVTEISEGCEQRLSKADTTALGGPAGLQQRWAGMPSAWHSAQGASHQTAPSPPEACSRRLSSGATSMKENKLLSPVKFIASPSAFSLPSPPNFCLVWVYCQNTPSQITCLQTLLLAFVYPQESC